MKRRDKAIALLFFFYSLFNNAAAQTEQPPIYSPDGKVTCMAAKGDTLIVGGNFNHVGKFTGCGALVTASSDQAILDFPKITGAVYSSTPDGSGGFYVYGKYRRESEPVSAESKRIEHIRADKTFEPGFSLAVNCVFNNGKILYHNGILYFGGEYVSSIAGQAAGDLAAIDVATKQLLPWVPVIAHSSASSINGLFAAGNTLYIMGNFSLVGGTARRNIAAIDIGTGNVTPWNFAANFPTAQSYYTMVAYGGGLIIGGGFTESTAPYTKHACAKVDAVTGMSVEYIFESNSLFGSGTSNLYWAAGVGTLAIKNNTLFAFSRGTFDTRITAVNLADSNKTIWAKYFNMIADATGMEVIGNSLHVGGTNFDNIYITNIDNNNPANIERNIKGAVSLNIFTGASESWNPDAASWNTTDVRCLSASGNNIFIGGAFTHLNCIDRGCVYMYNNSTETVLPFKINAAHISSWVNALKVTGDTLFVAGNSLKNSANGNSSVVAYNINTSAILSWSPVNLGEAYAVESDGNFVYLAGRLSEPAGGMNRTTLFALNRQTAALSPWAPNPNRDVTSLRYYDNHLFVGGDFTSISGQPRNRLASYYTKDLSLTGWNVNANNQVNAVAAFDHTVWAGGYFFNIKGASRRLFAAIDTAAGNLKASPVLNYGTSINGFANKGCYLFMGGSFRVNNTAPCNGLLAYDLFNKAIAPSTDYCVDIGDLSGNVGCIAITGNDVYFGGDFLKVNGRSTAVYMGRMKYPASFFDGCGLYISVQNGNWNNAATWQAGVVPPPSAKVIIRHNVQITANASCYHVKVEPGGAVQVNPGIALNITGLY